MRLNPSSNNVISLLATLSYLDVGILQVIRAVYSAAQKTLVDNIKADGRKVDLAGDGRCDSPGHSALYGVYSMMDSLTGKALYFELIKVR